MLDLVMDGWTRLRLEVPRTEIKGFGAQRIHCSKHSLLFEYNISLGLSAPI